jgi:intracellular multiplication protein IcmQ
MKDELTETQVNVILDALNEAIDNGPWEESNFLRVIGKNLREIRDNLVNEMSRGDLSHATKREANHAYQELMRSSMKLVYIALYSSEGKNLQAWERILANLSRQVLSRPIYSDELDVQFFIKSKENILNEAYVAIYIDHSNILTLAADRVPKDKFGKPLMTLKDRALLLENISYFVHNSIRYTYSKGRLIKSNL